MTDGFIADLLTVRDLFASAETTYTVPIYQRNYAWGAEQIEQLIGDIQDAIVDRAGSDDDDGYFLGNMVVTERRSKPVDYEVIDGQQRLTTLYLLLTFLAPDGTLDADGQQERLHHESRLLYESRPRSTEALRRISIERARHAGTMADQATGDDQSIHMGFNIIRQYMDQHVSGPARRTFARFLLDKVTVVRATLPRGTDLNRYFEIMNTRGQQLQQVDIVKARLMSRLDTDAERACFAWVWEACADMDAYLQMALTPGNTEGPAPGLVDDRGVR